jgi:hypothetical protein
MAAIDRSFPQYSDLVKLNILIPTTDGVIAWCNPVGIVEMQTNTHTCDTYTPWM